jgi:hypothetical protein
MAALLLASLLLTTVAVPAALAQDGSRTLPAAPTDAWSHVLFGGLADVVRQTAGRGALSGVVQQRTSAGVNLAVTVELTDAAAADALAANGLQIRNRQGTTVEGYAPQSLLAAIATTPGVRSVSPIRRHVEDAFVGSEVALHGANAWQAAGLTGAGVKIGIIDGGFQGVAALLGTELPAKVQLRCFTSVGVFTTNASDCNNGQDHGTGVAEAASDMAPGADLFLANPISALDTQSVITWMTANGVRIINASYGSGLLFEGPGDGTSPFKGTTYDDINLATSKGALWVNSAGNHADGGWTGAWADADNDGFLEFGPSDQNETLRLHKGQEITVAIRWAEPWGTAKANYNVGIYLHNDVELLQAGELLADGIPMRIFDFTAPSTDDYDINIIRLSGAATSRMQLLVASEFSLSMSHNVPRGTLISPADSANPLMLSVGAADATTPTTVEDFSSQGPTLDNRTKPDITGADCVDTVAIPEFCGTSEAAPFVSGGAALVLSANPSFRTSDIISYLTSHATPIEGPAPNNLAGYGLMNLGPVPASARVPVSLAFGVQPGGGPATVALPAQPVVRVLDDQAALVDTGVGSVVPVTLALGANPGGGTLTCTGGLTKAAVGGLATFAGCSVSAPGTGYTLVATSGNLTAATSSPFDVGAPPPPVPLVFTAVPAAGPANTPLTPGPVVKVADPQGNPVTAGPNATAPVTLSLGTNPSGATLFCRGGLTVAAVAGVATFTGCRISAAGSGYTLVATSSGLVTGTSTPFSLSTVVAGPATTLTASASAITWGSAVNLAARLQVPAGSTVALAGRTVHLESSQDNAQWSGVTDLTLDATGQATFPYRPVTNRYYRLVFDGAADLGGAISPTVRVTVRQLIAIRPDTHGKARTVKTGTTITFTVTVRPARPDVPPGRVTIELYQKVGSSWQRSSVRTAQPNAAGQIAFELHFGSSTGQRYVRAIVNPTSVNANSVWTEPQVYIVK